MDNFLHPHNHGCKIFSSILAWLEEKKRGEERKKKRKKKGGKKGGEEKGKE